MPQGTTSIIPRTGKTISPSCENLRDALTNFVLKNSFGENFVSAKLKLLQIFCNLDSVASKKLTHLNVRHYLEYYYVISIMRCSSIKWINLIIILAIMMSLHILGMLTMQSLLRQLPNCHLLQPPQGGGGGRGARFNQRYHPSVRGWGGFF